MRERPQYRFRGSVAPRPGQRTPLLASVDEPVVDESGAAMIRLYDPIDSWGGEWGVSAKEFTLALDQLSDAKRITMHINSPGGEVYEGIAILNALRRHPAEVTAVVDGLAASAASFIAAGADHVVMGRNTQLMIHDAWGICMGAAVDMQDMANRLDQLSNNIASVYQAKAGGSVEDWRGAMLAESWYNADEAVAAGLADRVEGVPDDQPLDVFDLSVFRHQGRADAPDPIVPEPDPVAESRERIQQRHRHNANKVRTQG
jgi:ATP-dependent Clp endopeptidase proteolytic subunit ClpP